MSKEVKRNANKLAPGDIFHPGEHLKDEISARGMNQQELADKADLSKSEISSIIHGRRNMTAMIAFKLESVLKISAEFWMNLQIKYDIDLLKRKYQRSIAKANVSAARKTRMGKLSGAA